MDFDVNVSKVQGILYSLGSQGLLNKKDSLQNVVEAISTVTHNLPDTIKSKITFLMVLNTQLSVSEDLKNDDYVCLFTNTTPYIEKEYLITYAYHLNLQFQLFKVIENCPGSLSLELLDVIIKKLKEPAFHRDEFGIEHLYKLWESVFVKICKLNAGLHLNDSCSPFMTYFQEVYDLIQKVLITSMKIHGLESFIGIHLYYFFKTVLQFLQHKNLNLTDDLVYQLSDQFRNGETDASVDHIKVCNSLVFEHIFKVLENFTVDMWMIFSECYFDFNSKNSMQLLIGSLVCNILDEVKDFDLPSDLLNCLSNLAIKKYDIMTKASVAEIIENVRNGEEEWFSALVSQDFASKNCLECLLNHLHLAGSEDLNTILNKSFDLLSSCKDDECLNLVKKLFLKALKTTPNSSYWIGKVFENYQPNLLTTADTHDEIIETFNKISKENNVPDCDVISLCMQSPFETIKKICQMAVCGSHQTDFVIDILKLLKQPCSTCPEHGYTLLDYVLLKFILNELTGVEKQPFINLAVALVRENFFKQSFFNNLLKTLKEYLEEEILERAVICLEAVKSLLDLELFQIQEAAFLVFMCQVLGFFSWDLTDFSTVKAEGRDLVGCIVALVIARLKGIDDAKFQWARKEILNSSEINQAHFCDLWFSNGKIWAGSGKIHSCILAVAYSRHKTDELRKFLTTFDEPSEVTASIIIALSVVLPVSTFREWNSIFTHLVFVSDKLGSWKSDFDVYWDVLDMFASAHFVLALKLKTDKKVFSCYQHCLQNFSRLVGLYCPKMNSGSFLQAFKKFFFIVDKIEDESERKCCWEICSPALMEMIDWMKKKKVVESDKNAIKEMLPFLDLKEVADVIERNL